MRAAFSLGEASLATLLSLYRSRGCGFAHNPDFFVLHPEEQHLVTKTSIFALSTQEISPVSETLQLREMEQ